MFEENTQKTNAEQSLSQEELNIFKEFSWELDFWPEKVSLYKEEVKKDKQYYLKLSNNIFSVLNIVLWFFILFFWLYLSVQNDETQADKSYLDPFCFAILWSEFKNTNSYCSSVASLIPAYNTKSQDLTAKTASWLSKIVWDVYDLENFTNSKEVTFLVNEKTQKLRVLDILNDFDKMKNDFAKTDKQSLVCDNITVNKDSELDISCEAFSSSWESSDQGWIIWDSWEKNSSIEWTSITMAVSFLNFIEKNPAYNFQVIEKQSDFDSESIVWEWAYVRKTKFSFKLKYNNFKNNLSL